MTELKKPLKRRAGELCVMLVPGKNPFLLVKKGKSRKWFQVSLEGIYCYACRLEAERIHREKAAERQTRP